MHNKKIKVTDDFLFRFYPILNRCRWVGLYSNNAILGYPSFLTIVSDKALSQARYKVAKALKFHL